MKKHIHISECDSTQDVLKEQLNNQTGICQFLVSCENQIQGRGRGNSSWQSMAGSLCLSFNLRAHPTLSYTALEVSVLIARFFEARGRQLKLKWPNDLWNEQNNKCGGILIQSFKETMIAGIGLNLFSECEEFGGIYDEPFLFDKRMLSQEIADFILHHRYKEVNSLREDWMKRCGHLKRFVTITEGNESFSGIFQGLGNDGECILQMDHVTKHIYNGSLRLKE